MSEGVRRPTGHVFRVERKRGPVWYAEYRLLDGRQEQRKLGPAWTERGRPAAGHFTKRLAEDWLRDTLDEARRGTLAEPVRTGATFADAAAEWLRYVEHDRDVKPSTLSDYRSVAGRLVQEFGSLAIEEVSARRIEEWRARLGAGRDRPLSNRTRNKSLTILGGIMERARKLYGLPSNPVRNVEKLRERYDATSFAFLLARRGPVEKLHAYALDPEHRSGRHEARVFSSVLGIEQHDWEYLRDQIPARVAAGPVTAIRPSPPWGTEYEVRVAIDGLNGVTHPIITGWLLPSDGPPRLITAYVELPRRV